MRIQISNLQFTYPSGTDALRGVSLEIPAGSRVALLGQNGAGKTTLVKHLNCLLKPSQGHVEIGDWNTRDRSIAQMARRVGFVFQNPDDQLFKTSVTDEISFGPTNLKWDAAEISKRVARAMALCGLEQLRDAHPYDLQPWQRHWVAIASVVAMQTPVVVLDEPTTGQDASGLARLTVLLDEWKREQVTVIAVTHDVDFAAEQFEDLIIMAQGEVIARGGASVFTAKSVLERAALDAPQLMRLARGLDWQESAVRVEDFCDVLARRPPLTDITVAD